MLFLQQLISMLESCLIPSIQVSSPRRSRNQLSSIELASQQVPSTTISWLRLTWSLFLLIHCAP
ncbi:hypothetical protein BCR37DRAFT_378093, partial [Protomyces lactucae-debilis]